MRLLLLVAALIGGLISSEIVNAEPSFTPRIAGSTFVVDAKNSENVRYNCIMDYTLEFLDFGKYRTEEFRTTTHVLPNANGAVLTHPTGKAATGLGVVKFHPICLPQRESSQPVTRLPGGTYHDSCHSCRMEGSVLHCRCDHTNTSIDINTCGDGRNQICNKNGDLMCPGNC